MEDLKVNLSLEAFSRKVSVYMNIMNIKWRRIFKINKNEITLKITRHYRNVVEFCLTNQKTNLKNNFLHTRDILFDVHCPLTGNLITIVIKSLYKDYDHYHWNEFYLFSRHVQQRPFTNIYIHWTIIEDQAIVRTASSLQLFPAGRFIITVHFFSPVISNARNTAVFVVAFTLFAKTLVHHPLR